MVEVLLFEKILRFFGYGQDHIDISIPTCYKISKNIWENDNTELSFIMKDVIDQIYYKINKDNKFRKKCKYVKFVYAKFMISTDNVVSSNISLPTNFPPIVASSYTSDLTVMIPYVDGVLYNPYDKSVMSALERERKINKLLS